MNELAHHSWQSIYNIVMPANPDKDQKSRLGFFIDWMAAQGYAWYAPDLQAYRDYLLYDRVKINPKTGDTRSAVLSEVTVLTHLATIRGRYEALLRDNAIRQMLFDLTPADASLADKKSFVDEILVRLQNAVHPSTAALKIVTKQDEADSEHLRLKPQQVKSLLRAPGIHTLHGLRDTAIIALFVCTGIREAELVDLDVSDLRQSINNELALLVRAGKGKKQRLVPYGPLDWCLIYVDRWLASAQIYAGPVFRGFYKGNKRVRDTRISKRAVNLILNGYPIMVDGQLRDVKPHDLRRTYARNAYDQGMDLERIRQNLGHTSLQTTQTYIGILDGMQRRPPMMFEPPHYLEELLNRPG